MLTCSRSTLRTAALYVILLWQNFIFFQISRIQKTFLLCILSTSEGTSHHLQPWPLKLVDLSPPLGSDPFSIIRLLYKALRKKYILLSTLLNYHIARIRAAGSQELTKSICKSMPGRWDPEHTSLPGQKVNATASPARKERPCPPGPGVSPRARALPEP